MSRWWRQWAAGALSIAWTALLMGCATIPLDDSEVVLTPSDASIVSAITGPLFDDYSLIVNPSRVYRVALDADGSLVAAKHRQLTLWDVEDGSVIAEWGREDGGSLRDWFAFDPQRPWLLVTGPRALERYDTRDGSVVRSWELPVGHWDRIHGCIAGERMWLALRRVLTMEEIVADHPTEDGMVLWAPELGVAHTVPIDLGEIFFTNDCRRVLSVGHDGGLSYVLTPTAAVAERWQKHDDFGRGGVAALLRGEGKRTLSPDGRLLAYGVDHFGGFNASPADLHVLAASSGRDCAVLSGHRDGIVAIAFSGDGRRMATGSRDQSVRVWQLPNSCR